jgi:hypothetical protein
MAKKQYESLVTEKGSALFSKINNCIDQYEGKDLGYVINVYFSDSVTKALIADVTSRLEAAQASEEFTNEKTGKPKKWLDNPFVPYATDDDGKVFFKFKTSHLKRDSEGNETRKYVPVFDSKNKPIANDVTIGNGSIVKIAYSPSVYHMNANVNGLKFFINAVQVVELVEFGGGSDGNSYGFGEVAGGFVAKETPDTISDPFTEDGE